MSNKTIIGKPVNFLDRTHSDDVSGYMRDTIRKFIRDQAIVLDAYGLVTGRVEKEDLVQLAAIIIAMELTSYE